MKTYHVKLCCAVILMGLYPLSVLAITADPIDPCRIDTIAKWLPEKPHGLGRPVSDRTAWEGFGKKNDGARHIRYAEKLLKQEPPQLTDELYLEFTRHGNRTRYQDQYQELERRFNAFALAECLENRGRFIPVLEEAVRQTCRLKSWTLPAHDEKLTDFQGKEHIVALGSSRLAWQLAEIEKLTGEKLSPAVREELRKNVHQRVLVPIKIMIAGKRSPHWWFKTGNNWNAVCWANVTGAALALIEAPQERALYVAAAEHYINYFLNDFPEDGYCSEGLGYWNYGYGHFLMLTETVHQATIGQLDFFKLPNARRAASFGRDIMLTETIAPAFADCRIGTRPDSNYMYYLSHRQGLSCPAPSRPTCYPGEHIFEILLFNFPGTFAKTAKESIDTRWKLPARTWFDKSGILLCRPGPEYAECRLAAAFKGGHNAEHHNHNDLGSYVVVVDNELVLADPGSEVYTSRTFSSRRYESKVMNSYGHPVPVLGGKLQKTGRKAQAKIMATDFQKNRDRLVFDLTSAYDLEDLSHFEREFTFDRKDDGMTTLIDTIEFTSPQTYENAFITFGDAEQTGPDTLKISHNQAAVTVYIMSVDNPYQISHETINEKLRSRKKPTRIAITIKEPSQKIRMIYRIHPTRDRNQDK